MRRKEKEIVRLSDIEEVIGKATSCRIGLVDDGEPYIVPVSFGYERGALYFHGASIGRKAEILRRSNRVCFQMDADVEMEQSTAACGWGVRYRSVVGVGTARVLFTAEEKKQGLGAIMEHYAVGEFSFPEARLAETMVVRIDIESITGKQSGY